MDFSVTLHLRVYQNIGAWEGIGEDTESSYSAKPLLNIAERLAKKINFLR
jgi:hypothetical protein